MSTEQVISDSRRRDAYLRDGFATLPRLVPGTELDWLRDVYDGLFAETTRIGPGDYYDIAGREDEDATPRLPQIIRPEKYAPELLDSGHFRRCRSTAATLLETPEEELDFYGHAILKPPRYGAPTPWHQDEAYMDPAWYRKGLSIWTTLDEATEDSGCLHFVPGRHREPVLPHRHIDHDDRVRGLTTDHVDDTKAVVCPLKTGEASVHDFRTPHYAGPNRTDRPRRAYVLVFMGPASPVASPPHRSWRTEE